MPVTQSEERDPAIEVELDRLASMPIVQLRLRYNEVLRAEPPPAFGPDLLRRSIAHRLQEKAYGGLSRPLERLLDQIVKVYSAQPNGKLMLPRRIKPGSLLVRNWKGKSHRVAVLSDGFLYDGVAYPSLSEIAVLITGTRWNGPKFFGLRSKAPDVGKAKVDPPRTRNDPPAAGPSKSLRNAGLTKRRRSS